MNEKIKTLIDIIMEAYNNTHHCVNNPYYYSFTMRYDGNGIDAGVDEIMEIYIKRNTPQDIYNQYDWYKSDGGRMFISIK